MWDASKKVNKSRASQSPEQRTGSGGPPMTRKMSVLELEAPVPRSEPPFHQKKRKESVIYISLACIG